MGGRQMGGCLSRERCGVGWQEGEEHFTIGRKFGDVLPF